MGTATARVRSAVYPPWMAMVSSCMASVAPLRDTGQQVGVQPDGYAAPRPGGPGRDLVEGKRLDDRGIPFASGHPLLQSLELCPILGGHAVERQTRFLVALVEHVTPDIA